MTVHGRDPGGVYALQRDAGGDPPPDGVVPQAADPGRGDAQPSESNGDVGFRTRMVQREGLGLLHAAPVRRNELAHGLS
jgi:hypothetical protein